MLRKGIYALAVLLVLALGYLYYSNDIYVGDLYAGTLSIGDTTIVVEIVDTHPSRALGLGGRKSLLSEAGMLFVFEESGFYPFWMKDMKFPLDIIWIDKFMKVVDIKKNVSPDTYPQAFTPKEEALYVVEVNAGFADKHKVTIGEETKLVKH